MLREGVAATTLDAIAEEAGLTKAALYYYFPSKEVLLFEISWSTLSAHARALHDAVERAETGAAALRAVITETICGFATQMDDFRLTFLHAQVARPGSVKITAEQLARLRPLNDLSYAGTASRLARDFQRARGRARVEPRLLAFLAQAAAIGVLTFKGMVESADDPLLYTDQQLIDALCRIFEAAATP